MKNFLVTLLLIFVVQLCFLPASVGAEGLPTKVPLIKLEYPGKPKNIRMLYVKILSLGDRTVNQPLLLDTGSSGMTIDCKSVLPAETCSDTGIKITQDQQIDGITVTTKKAVMNYGTYDEYGNVAYARVTFGSPELSGLHRDLNPIPHPLQKSQARVPEKSLAARFGPRAFSASLPLAEADQTG